VNTLILSPNLFPRAFFARTGRYIAGLQQDSGAIPWFAGGLLDPWDHVEAAMGLAVAGWHAEARLAYLWMAERQERDGGFWPAYADGAALDRTRKESHHAAYLATGLWHYYLCSGDKRFVAELWPCAEAGLDFACDLQSAKGEIAWAALPDGKPYPDALVTGCSSIFKSLECGLLLADLLDLERPDWIRARRTLGQALRQRPGRFDRTWESKERFAMDWFYPVLCGVVRGAPARRRLQARWSRFVDSLHGCRCVSDEPWVTVAESSELVIALVAAGLPVRAARVFSWLHAHRKPSGAYWTGYQLRLEEPWPKEQPTWTAGAVLLAADALVRMTPAAGLFTGVSLVSEMGLPLQADAAE
jgi:hypothetical protein